VTPNKFRPPSKLGDMVTEHPQNSSLIQILNTNIALIELSQKHLRNPEEARGATAGPGPELANQMSAALYTSPRCAAGQAKIDFPKWEVAVCKT
jgi:hypothetical protein